MSHFDFTFRRGWMALGACLAAASFASAQQPAQYQPQAAPVPVQAQVTTVAPSVAVAPGGGSYYSWRLQTNLVVEIWDLTRYGSPGPRMVGRIAGPVPPSSPLWQLGLQPGDAITRLDGLPITSAGQFDNHYDQTSVTFIKTGAPYAQLAYTYLGPPAPAYPQPYPYPVPAAAAPAYAPTGFNP